MKRDKKKERKQALEALTRQGIYDAVIDVLMRDGMQGLTMDRVAREAGVAKGTLYIYFENKDKLLEAAVDASFDPLGRQLIDLLTGDVSPDMKLAEFTLCFLQYFEERRDLIRVFFYDLERVHADKHHYVDSRYRNMLHHLAAVIDEGIERGLFNSRDSMKVAAMYMEANMGVVMHRIYDDITGDVEHDAREIADVFMHGLQRRE